MARLRLIVAVGREYLNQNPNAKDDQLRAYLTHEFMVNRDIELCRCEEWQDVPPVLRLC